MKHLWPGGTYLVFVGGMEGCWIIGALWLVEARTAPEMLPDLLLMLGVPLAFVLGRLARSLPRLRRITAGLVAGFAWMLLLIKFSAISGPALVEPIGLTDVIAGLFQGKGGPNPIQISALAAAATWIVGLRLAAMQVDFDRLLSEFQFGLLVLLCVFFCAAQWESELPAMPAVAFLFFSLSLLGMAAVRGNTAGGWLKGEGRSRWIAALFFNAALALVAGLLLTAVVTPGALATILGFLEAIWDTMIEWVVRIIAFLARLIPQPEIKAYGIGGGSGPAAQNPSAIADLLSIPDYLRRIAAFLVSFFWLVLFGVCLWRVASQIAGWLRQQMNDRGGAEIETLRGSFRQDWLRLLRLVRRRVTGWLAWLKYAIRRRAFPETMPAETAAVRQVYRALLAWSAAGGCPRKRYQTPHEFLCSLCEWLPQAREQLTLITDRYAAVRYGGRQPDADSVETLEQTWQDVRHMRKLSGARAK
jgi:hypothetical protein